MSSKSAQYGRSKKKLVEFEQGARVEAEQTLWKDDEQVAK